MRKERLNLAFDQDLVLFIRGYAQENRTTLTDLFTQYMLTLMRNMSDTQNPSVVYDRAFNKTMEDIRTAARSGNTKWHTYEEVFGKKRSIKKRRAK